MAEKFSFEMLPVSQTFGFHGLYNLPSIMGLDVKILFDHLQPKTAVRARPLAEREFFTITAKITPEMRCEALPMAREIGVLLTHWT